ncbi:ClpX C4-type zinc finger protein [Geobacillus subterraneus]|uniref:ClpX C4-type zinc finger protein n=1 Tax=Geobacillus subterraneus TaxID=129338 RepID=UPI0016108B29
MTSGTTRWLDECTTAALERFADEVAAMAEQSGDEARRRFYEGMAVAAKLTALRWGGKCGYIDGHLLDNVYEALSVFPLEKLEEALALEAQEARDGRCSFCLKEKPRLVNGPLAAICEDCLRFGLQVITKQL